MARLMFSAEALRPIVKYTLSKTKHSPTLSQLTDPALLKPGQKLPAKGWATADRIDLTKIPPSLHFVKDDGIYLLSSAAERDLVTVNGRERSHVVYAKGYDPDQDEDVWEASRAAVGGDDFVEALPIEWFNPILENHSIASVVINVTKKNIKVAYTNKL